MITHPESRGSTLRNYLGIALVLVLAGAGMWMSYWGTTIYLAARSGLDGLRLSCHILQTAETKAVITKDQRSIVIKEFLRLGGGSDKSSNDQLIAYLRSDCSKTFIAEIWGNLKN